MKTIKTDCGKRVVAISALGIALIAIGCGANNTTDEAPVCAPGEIQRCPCTATTEGLQECREDRSGWGPCTQCGASTTAADTDTNTAAPSGDTDSDTGPLLGECEYAACEGETCQGVDSCCQGAACADWIFTNEDEYIENYCYPMCAPETEAERCKCGDQCLEVDGLSLCVKTGGAVMADLTSVAGADYGFAGVTATEDLTFNIDKGGDQVWIDEFFMFWDEWTTSTGEVRYDFAILGRGYVGDSSQWLLWITMPQEIFERGEGEYTNETERTFYAELYFGNYNSSGSLTDLWLEAALDMDDSTLIINQTCEPCGPGAEPDIDAGVDGGATGAVSGPDAGPDGGVDTDFDDSGCGRCSVSFDFFWYALRAKIGLSG